MDNSAPRTSEESRAQLQYLGELVSQGFANLERKYRTERPSTSTRESASRNFAVDGVNSKEILYDRLISTLLPRLKAQVNTISATLEPASMKKDPESSLRRVLEIQPELDHNITQIDTDLLQLCPESLSSCGKTDDQHLKQFKAYRLAELKDEFVCILDWICSVSRATPRYIEAMELSRGGFFDHDDDDMYGQKEYAEKAVYMIEWAIVHSKRSEMGVLESTGKHGVRRIESRLIDLIMRFTPTDPSEIAEREPFRHRSSIYLAKLTVPIVKLLRLFYKKLSQIAINFGKTLISHTQMNSEQLKYVCESVEKVNRKLGSFEDNLSDIDTEFGDTPVNIRSLAQPLEEIASYLEGPLTSIVLYLVPLVDNLPDQTYFRSWFALWNSQFNIAIHNVLQAAQNLDQNQLG
ncbi:hypothetical protein PGTUg99_025730 [Puccinia graminis f. sp. tritici]|uniref:Uncharacterized protein n=1 Tax=Puccinia graminis f. sp. tritici TaxID=56615 RepID=A0A5B0NJA4_PUCGR|nr:hypothetical protein PGTUg99_025730 [Puccinia graminis f. sp. tritici]